MSDISRSADLDATSLERVAGGEDDYGGGGGDYTSSYSDTSSYGSDPTYEESAYAGQSSGYGGSTYGSDPTYEESAYAGESSGSGSSTYGSDPTYEESAYAGQSSGYGNSTYGSDPTYEESAYAGQANGHDNSTYGSDPTYEESAYAGQANGYGHSFDNGYDQEAGLTRDGMPPVTQTPYPTITSSSTQRYDDGTSLETYRWSNGGTTTRSNVETIQRYDDGSRFITNEYSTRTSGSDLVTNETRTSSVNDIESRLDPNGDGFGRFLDHPSTATRDDIFTAHDIMDNSGYQERLPYHVRDGLNDYINGYYTGTNPPVFDGLAPTPRNYTPTYRGIG